MAGCACCGCACGCGCPCCIGPARRKVASRSANEILRLCPRDCSIFSTSPWARGNGQQQSTDTQRHQRTRTKRLPTRTPVGRLRLARIHLGSVLIAAGRCQASVDEANPLDEQLRFTTLCDDVDGRGDVFRLMGARTRLEDVSCRSREGCGK